MCLTERKKKKKKKHNTHDTSLLKKTDKKIFACPNSSMLEENEGLECKISLLLINI